MTVASPSTIRFVFGRDDLLRTRFAISPLIELVAATFVLRRPPAFPEHRRWVAAALPRVAALDLGRLFAVNPLGRSAWPNFNAPPPVAPHPSIDDELDRVASTPSDTVVADVRRAYGDDVPAAARPFVDHPERALRGLVAEMRSFWDAALAPWWPSMAGFLEAEIAGRARRLASAGGQTAFADLDPTVAWDGRELTIAPVKLAPRTIRLRGRGLLLIPSVLAFGTWPRVDAPWTPALTYQPPGAADLWLPDGDVAVLDQLIGRRRAALLRALEQPCSTRTLAARTGWSAGGVNTHLTVLRRAGLVSRRRDGREVYYGRTGAGEALAGR